MPRLAAALVLLLLAAPLVPAAGGDPISDVAVDDRGTAAVLSWTTADAVASTVTYAVDGGAPRLLASPAGTTHSVVLTFLTPGLLVTYEIAAGAATATGSFTPRGDLAYYLHYRVPENVTYADEFDTAGDVSGRGFNLLGSAVDTVTSQTGVDLLTSGLSFPTKNGALVADGAGHATIYIRLSLSAPTAGNVLYGPPAEARFRVEVLSGAGVLATGTADISTREVADVWHRLDVPLAGAGGAAARGALTLRVVAEHATAGYLVGLEGDHASFVTLTAGPAVANPLRTDFTLGPRVVVAVIDTGINPYHPVYARPGAVMPLAEMLDNGTRLPRVVDLADSGTYAQRVAADNATWSSIQPYELVWFKDTNVLAISPDPPPTGHVIRDPSTGGAADGHGTMTSSTVLANFPNAIIVMVQVSDPGLDTIAATQWAAKQPWIDVITTSIGAAGNAPSPSAGPAIHSRAAYNAGKVVLNSAGNDPSPLVTDRQDGPHWVIAITGSQAEGRSKEVLSSNVYPDYVAPYTVMAAKFDSADNVFVRTGGTSFSTPGAAGVVAGIIYKVREAKGHEGGIVAKELAPGVTNRDVRAALNKTALLPARDGYVAGINWNGDHAHPPGAPWLTAQWGQVDGRVMDAAVGAILADDYSIPAEKAEAARYKAATYEARAAYWRLYGG